METRQNENCGNHVGFVGVIIPIKASVPQKETISQMCVEKQLNPENHKKQSVHFVETKHHDGDSSSDGRK
jgi:hypothetical protein